MTHMRSSLLSIQSLVVWLATGQGDVSEWEDRGGPMHLAVYLAVVLAVATGCGRLCQC